MFVLFIAVLVLAVVIIFSVQNATPVAVAFLGWKFSASLAVVVFLSFVIGIAVAGLFILGLRFKKAARRGARKRESVKP